MRLIVLKSYPTARGYTLNAYIDEIPAEIVKETLLRVQIALNRIIEDTTP